MRRIAAVFALVLGMLLVGCDAAGPEDDTDPEPHFELALGAPINASIEGEATLGDGTSFDEQHVYTFPAEPFGRTITIIQLFSEDDGIAHDLSFQYIADEAMTEGTYEVGIPNPCEGEEPSECTPRMFIPDEMLMAHYARLTDDSLHTHMLQSGTLTIDRATDEVVEGTFALEAPLEVSVARTDLEAFQDSLREYTRNHSPEEGHLDDFPEPPPFDLTVLEPPLPVEGTFTAAPGAFSDRVPRSSWSITIGAAMPDEP